MKSRYLKDASRVGMVSFLLAGSLAAAPAPSKSAVPGKSANPEPVEPGVPQSVFSIPRNLKEGRDPFFPNSTHFLTTPVLLPGPKTNQPVTLVVNGIIPSAEKPLVMINGRTFAPGETAEVSMGPGQRIRVTCIEIRFDSVIVDVNGVRRELRPKTGTK